MAQRQERYDVGYIGFSLFGADGEFERTIPLGGDRWRRPILSGGIQAFPGMERVTNSHRAPVNRDAGSGSLPPAPGLARRFERRERSRFPSSTVSEYNGTALPALEPGALRDTVLQG